MNCKILIIGGTGTLSIDVVKLSLSKGHQVYILNRGNNVKSIPKSVKLLKADIKNSNRVNEVIKNHHFDVVVDFLSYKINDLKNSLALLEKKCNQFIFISSACVYRRAEEDGIIKEDSPLINSNWSYSKDKVDCEEYLIGKCSESELKYTIVRPYITYGDTRIPYGIMPSYGWHWTLISRILNNKPVFLWDDGSAICTLTHTSDFAVGLVGLFNNNKAYNEAFHIVGDETISWESLLNLIGKLVNKKPIITKIPSNYVSSKLPHLKGMLLGDRSLNAVFDNSKIKKVVPEFITKTSLNRGVLQTINAYKENNYMKGIDYKWDAQMDKLIDSYLYNTSGSYRKLKLIPYFKITFKEKTTYFLYRYFPRIVILIYEIVMKILYKIKFFK
jgi:nucleoside-diphosphate-sugar epimerase